jgi:hypothetical protein
MDRNGHVFAEPDFQIDIGECAGFNAVAGEYPSHLFEPDHGIVHTKPGYSILKASVGFTRVARRAGIRQAARETPERSAITATNVAGSVTPIPHN